MWFLKNVEKNGLPNYLSQAMKSEDQKKLLINSYTQICKAPIQKINPESVFSYIL